MKKTICIFASLLFSLTFLFAQTSIPAEADQLLQQHLAEKDFVGVSAGIFANGQILWSGGGGFLNLEQQVKADSSMRHRLASISKPMTAVAIMQLVEQGKLKLDDPIQHYLPEFPVKKEGPITLRNLLNHSSGLDHFSNTTSTKHYDSVTEAMRAHKDKQLPKKNKPGQYSYSTYGYTVLGAIIEKVTGMNYVEYMEQYIWHPSGMYTTGIEEFGKTYPNKASLYQRNKKGAFVPDKKTDLSVKYPGGGIQSTASDLLRFGQAVLENKLIDPATLALMYEPQPVKKEGTPYGLGWYVADHPEYGQMIRHGGRQSGTSTYFIIFLDKGIAISVLSNDIDSGNAVNTLIWELYGLVGALE